MRSSCDQGKFLVLRGHAGILLKGVHLYTLLVIHFEFEVEVVLCMCENVCEREGSKDIKK